MSKLDMESLSVVSRIDKEKLLDILLSSLTLESEKDAVNEAFSSNYIPSNPFDKFLDHIQTMNTKRFEALQTLGGASPSNDQDDQVSLADRLTKSLSLQETEEVDISIERDEQHATNGDERGNNQSGDTKDNRSDNEKPSGGT